MNTPKRLSPIGLLLRFAKTVMRLWPLYVIIVFNFASGRDRMPTWLAFSAFGAIIGITLVISVISYLRFTYQITPQDITIASGIFNRKLNHIPYGRIQTVQRQQWFFLKPLGLEEVRIETAGKASRKAEGVLDAVPVAVADQINRYRTGQTAAPLDAKQPETTPSAVPTGPSYAIDPRDLNRYALTSLGFVPLILAISGIVERLQRLVPEKFFDDTTASLIHLGTIVLVALIVIIVLAGFVVSYLNILQKYWHFTLRQNDAELETSRGLFQTNTVNAKVTRIQALRLKQTVLRQWLHLATAQALVASNAADDEQNKDLVLMPVAEEASVLHQLKPFLPWLPEQVGTLTGVPKSYHWLYMRNIVLGNLVFIVLPLVLVLRNVTWAKWYIIMPLAIVYLIIIALQGQYSAVNAGVQILSDEILVMQFGTSWTRHQYIVRRENIQSMVLTQSIWMQPKQIATIQIHIRRGNSDQDVTIKYLEHAVAEQILAWYQPLPSAATSRQV